MSDQGETIRALQVQMEHNAKTMDRLRAVNKKLRAELATSERQRNVYKEASTQNWTSVLDSRRDLEEALKVSRTWADAFHILATRGKAK